MKTSGRARRRRFLAGGALVGWAVLPVSCRSTNREPENGESLVAPELAADAPWQIRSGLGTEDEYARTGGVDEDAFWAANAGEAGVILLPSGLRYRVVRAGDGPLVGDAPRVRVAYVTGALDGSRLADSRDEGGAVELEVARMNPGWREAVPKMREGAIWRLYVPAALGRSPADLGPVPSRIYDVELVGIVPGE